jgi:hypothetical protein
VAVFIPLYRLSFDKPKYWHGTCFVIKQIASVRLMPKINYQDCEYIHTERYKAQAQYLEESPPGLTTDCSGKNT